MSSQDSVYETDDHKFEPGWEWNSVLYECYSQSTAWGKTLQNGEERYKETKVGQKQISTNPQQSKKTSNNNGS